jgi:cell wall-associated NlpC family hydrolase
MNHFQTGGLSPVNSLRSIGSAWWLPYLLVPFKENGRDMRGWDCFGCVRYVLKDQTGIELPMFDFHSAAEILRQSEKPEWIKANAPKQFDIVCVNVPTPRGLRPIHVGIMVDEKRVLHCESGFHTICVPFDHRTMRGDIRGFYRHHTLETR